MGLYAEFRFFVAVDDYAQEVRVINTVDTEAQGSVRVDVNNTVGIDIQAINGNYNAFYGKKEVVSIMVFLFKQVGNNEKIYSNIRKILYGCVGARKSIEIDGN